MGLKSWWQKRSNTFKGFILGLPAFYILILLMNIIYITVEFLRGMRGPYDCLGKNTINCPFWNHLMKGNEILLILVALWAVPLFMILGGIIGFIIDISRKNKR